MEKKYFMNWNMTATGGPIFLILLLLGMKFWLPTDHQKQNEYFGLIKAWIDVIWVQQRKNRRGN